MFQTLMLMKILQNQNIGSDLKDIDFDSSDENIKNLLDKPKQKNLVNPADVDIENHRIDWDKHYWKD